MRCTSRPHKHMRKAFASFLAMALLVLLSMAMLSVSRAFADHAARTRRATVDTQLRQLLLAGTWQAMNIQKTSSAAGPWSKQLELPPALAAMSATLRIDAVPIARNSSGNPAHMMLTIIASMNERSAAQTITVAAIGEFLNSTDIKRTGQQR